MKQLTDDASDGPTPGPAVGTIPPTPGAALLTPGAALRDPGSLAVADTSSLVGFGGLHGGLVLALSAGAMRPGTDEPGTPPLPLRWVTGQFLRPLRGPLDIENTRTAAGRSVIRTEAVVRRGGRDLLRAAAAFGRGAGGTEPDGPADHGVPTGEHDDRPVTVPPVVAGAGSPLDHPVFAVPVEFVPFTRHVEIRAVGDRLPFTGGDRPELTAWIRFVEDDLPPDELRLITLLDALAPSVSAVLRVPAEVPTLELSVRPSPALGRTRSPWVLLHARTHSSSDGWIDERLDAWSPDGDHLGSATQVRLLRS